MPWETQTPLYLDLHLISQALPIGALHNPRVLEGRASYPLPVPQNSSPGNRKYYIQGDIMTDRTWYLANLLPGAHGIFDHSFYPAKKRGTGNQVVFFCMLSDAQGRVIVASHENATTLQMKLLSRQLAVSFIEPRLVPVYGYEKATMAQMNKLNLNADAHRQKFTPGT